MFKCHTLGLGELTGVMDQMDSQEEVEVVAVMKTIVTGDTDPIRKASQPERSLFFALVKEEECCGWMTNRLKQNNPFPKNQKKLKKELLDLGK